MPRSDEISEEGFGYFRGTWSIGRMPVSEALATVNLEAEIIDWLDVTASSPDDFERLATAIEAGDADSLPARLRETAEQQGIARYVTAHDDFCLLGGLEIGVAGLTGVLSSIRCLTAASCRSHQRPSSWSDCPIVFFAAPAWRLEILAALISETSCGLGEDRDMLTVYGPSIKHTNQLASCILSERARFRKKPTETLSSRRTSRPTYTQSALFPYGVDRRW